METELSKAIKILSKALAEDKSQGSYYFSWQANIVMAMLDEFERSGLLLQGTKLYVHFHEACNEGAKNFLDLLTATTLDKESLNHE